MSRQRYFRIDATCPRPDPVPLPPGFVGTFWRPAWTDLRPGGLAAYPYAFWSVLSQLGVFARAGYGVYLVHHEGRLAHHSCIIPKYHRFPFMAPDDLQICSTFTDPEFRGMSLAKHGVDAIVDRVLTPSTAIWYFADEDNAASIRVVESRGFRSAGYGARTAPLGVRLLGQYVISEGAPGAPPADRARLDALRRTHEALGDRVVELAGGLWLRYGGALIPLEPMPTHPRPGRLESAKAMISTRALFTRWQVPTARERSEWWHMVCRDYRFDALSSNTRSQIRRGRKRHVIRELSADELARLGHACHVAAHERYRGAEPMDADAYARWARTWLDSGVGSAVAAFAAADEDELAGYILCVESPLGVFMHTVDVTPTGLKNYASAALIDHVLERRVAGEGTPVCNGTRSVLHETNMQDYLLRLGFRREYSRLRVRYLPGLGLAVRAAYPLRGAVEHLGDGDLKRKLGALFYQESLARDQVPLASLYLNVAKPALDRAAGVAGLAALAGPMLAIAAAIRVSDGAPVLYSQTRIGKDGAAIRVHKFRTMKSRPAAESGSSVTVRGDSRITPIGAWLRRLKLDELPQLINVADGTMSFVGPRPDVPGYADRLDGADRVVLAVKPGITGPATLRYRNEEELLAQQADPVRYNDEVIYPDKVRINREYVANASLARDLACVLETVLGARARRVARWLEGEVAGEVVQASGS